MILYAGLLLALAAAPGASAEMVFRCPSCTAERQAACAALTETCAEIVREPGCGCCPVCARKDGELCGVYTPRCSSGLRCYPEPDSELPLEQLVQGRGRCGRKVDQEPRGSPELSQKQACVTPGGEGDYATEAKQKPCRAWARVHLTPFELCTTRWDGVFKENTLPQRLSEESQCQQELDQVLERISTMPFRDNRGPLEDLYSLHIPNCDKKGQYNLKQCKMSVDGQRGECWCVDPHTGRTIPTLPRVRGDPNCNQYLDDLETEPVSQN
ncbi:LOW QUALITY PROTEIN: insulin-like growth factor-binding protein 2-A [Brachyhypopomus gauderio]|uniref:LOW QUALITY PROTEIN: insulin-like growth factor-binding protein 2-A n=1 Tax=Brachyhypopomus gauderio TaxID=698409 RepID=UPI004043256E